jgi:hypothetical protein
MLKALKALVVGAVCVSGSAALAQADGPDVIYQNITSTWNYGLVGETRAYAFDSYTCNIGTQNLRWGGSWQGSPALAMNLYRINDGRMVQIGLSWCKQACCAAASTGCGTCNGTGGTMLGVGCRDVYGANYNGGQTRLAPRSQINAFTGAMTLAPTTTGDAIYKRLQVDNKDVDPTIPGSIFIGEGVYVANDDAPVGNHYNNATWKQMTVHPTSRDLTPVGAAHIGEPAIYAWRALGGPNGTEDASVNIFPVDIPGEGRVYLGAKVSELPNGEYLYTYALYNLNSDKSIRSFSFPFSNNANLKNVGQNLPKYHSGEPYLNVNWTLTRENRTLSFATPQTYEQQPNTSALRWGTMYTFWFVSDAAPRYDGTVTLGVFKPHTVPSVEVTGVAVPGPTCGTADFNRDSEVGTDADIEAFFACLGGNCCPTCQSVDFNDDGDMGTDADIESFFRVLAGEAC